MKKILFLALFLFGVFSKGSLGGPSLLTKPFEACWSYLTDLSKKSTKKRETGTRSQKKTSNLESYPIPFVHITLDNVDLYLEAIKGISNSDLSEKVPVENIFLKGDSIPHYLKSVSLSYGELMSGVISGITYLEKKENLKRTENSKALNLARFLLQEMKKSEKKKRQNSHGGLSFSFQAAALATVLTFYQFGTPQDLKNYFTIATQDVPELYHPSLFHQVNRMITELNFSSQNPQDYPVLEHMTSYLETHRKLYEKSKNSYNQDNQSIKYLLALHACIRYFEKLHDKFPLQNHDKTVKDLEKIFEKVKKESDSI